MATDPYYRNNDRAHQALKAAGHHVTKEGWGGGTEGLTIPLESGHRLDIGQPAGESNGTWHMRVTRNYEDPGYDQGGLKLGDPGKTARVPGPTPRRGSSAASTLGDDHYSSSVVSKPADLPTHVAKFLNHPQVRNALRTDIVSQRADAAMKGPSPLSPRQFGG